MIKSTVILGFLSKIQEIAINVVAYSFIRNLGKLVEKFYVIGLKLILGTITRSEKFLIPMLLVNPFLRYKFFSKIQSFLWQMMSYNCIWLLLCPESYPRVVTMPLLFRQVAQHYRTGGEGRVWQVAARVLISPPARWDLATYWPRPPPLLHTSACLLAVVTRIWRLHHRPSASPEIRGRGGWGTIISSPSTLTRQ